MPIISTAKTFYRITIKIIASIMNRMKSNNISSKNQCLNVKSQ